eukprot:TRINITY_DN31495_c0_g2_i1.p1 TRINITY_DN31495_c0_g2~~TRINITY_DN31495_c0_g2_i1.p1  ORF type:complete len:744 (+),score=108.75 TRINITY_DN31495_c0_g2_i1:78-2309(+)
MPAMLRRPPAQGLAAPAAPSVPGGPRSRQLPQGRSVTLTVPPPPAQPLRRPAGLSPRASGQRRGTAAVRCLTPPPRLSHTSAVSGERSARSTSTARQNVSRCAAKPEPRPSQAGAARAQRQRSTQQRRPRPGVPPPPAQVPKVAPVPPLPAAAISSAAGAPAGATEVPAPGCGATGADASAIAAAAEVVLATPRFPPAGGSPAPGPGAGSERLGTPGGRHVHPPHPAAPRNATMTTLTTTGSTVSSSAPQPRSEAATVGAQGKNSSLVQLIPRQATEAQGAAVDSHASRQKGGDDPDAAQAVSVWAATLPQVLHGTDSTEALSSSARRRVLSSLGDAMLSRGPAQLVRCGSTGTVSTAFQTSLNSPMLQREHTDECRGGVLLHSPAAHRTPGAVLQAANAEEGGVAIQTITTYDSTQGGTLHNTGDFFAVAAECTALRAELRRARREARRSRREADMLWSELGAREEELDLCQGQLMRALYQLEDQRIIGSSPMAQALLGGAARRTGRVFFARGSDRGRAEPRLLQVLRRRGDGRGHILGGCPWLDAMAAQAAAADSGEGLICTVAAAVQDSRIVAPQQLSRCDRATAVVSLRPLLQLLGVAAAARPPSPPQRGHLSRYTSDVSSLLSAPRSPPRTALTGRTSRGPGKRASISNDPPEMVHLSPRGLGHASPTSGAPTLPMQTAPSPEAPVMTVLSLFPTPLQPLLLPSADGGAGGTSTAPPTSRERTEPALFARETFPERPE